MHPTLSIRFSKPLRKNRELPATFPAPLSLPSLSADYYRNRNTHVLLESLPGFGVSFGHVQLSCDRIVRGTWRVSAPCVVIVYSESGQAQLAIRGYGDAIAPFSGSQSGTPVPAGSHFFFANAGFHRFYYFAISLDMLAMLSEEMPPLARLGNVPDYDTDDHWQDYAVAEEDFKLLEAIMQTDLRHLQQQHFVQQQFHRLMKRYAERIERYGDNPEAQTETAFRKAVDYIREHYTNPTLTVAVIAAKVHLSVAALEKQFQRHSFKSAPFINALRSYHGADLLRDTTLSVADVSTLSGFRNRERFTVVFKEKFGVNPNDYRNRLKINKK